eukprot:scaffold58619_cov39-Phaeocystis_antarctica.AAC.1
MSRLRAIARSLRVPQSQNARCKPYVDDGGCVGWGQHSNDCACGKASILTVDACFAVIMFFWQISASSEERRHTHLRIKSPPDGRLPQATKKSPEARRFGYGYIDTDSRQRAKSAGVRSLSGRVRWRALSSSWKTPLWSYSPHIVAAGAQGSWILFVRGGRERKGGW